MSAFGTEALRDLIDFQRDKIKKQNEEIESQRQTIKALQSNVDAGNAKIAQLEAEKEASRAANETKDQGFESLKTAIDKLDEAAVVAYADSLPYPRNDRQLEADMEERNSLPEGHERDLRMMLICLSIVSEALTCTHEDGREDALDRDSNAEAKQKEPESLKELEQGSSRLESAGSVSKIARPQSQNPVDSHQGGPQPQRPRPVEKDQGPFAYALPYSTPPEQLPLPPRHSSHGRSRFDLPSLSDRRHGSQQSSRSRRGLGQHSFFPPSPHGDPRIVRTSHRLPPRREVAEHLYRMEAINRARTDNGPDPAAAANSSVRADGRVPIEQVLEDAMRPMRENLGLRAEGDRARRNAGDTPKRR